MGRYDSRRLVWVPAFTGSDIKYGFRTNVDEAVSGILGHNLVPDTYPAGLVIGANAPKPPRASRRRATGYESSFVASSAIAAARAAGFSVRPGKVRISRSTNLSTPVYVLHEGNKIAWRMTRAQYQRITTDDLTALGIRIPGAADDDLIYGASYPRLPTVAFVASGTDGFDVISTKADPSKLNSLPTGWGTIRATQDRF